MADNAPHHPTVEYDGSSAVRLPDVVRRDRKMLCWLYHRVVNLLADYGHYEWIRDDIEHRLGSLSPHLIKNAIRDLVAEARAHRAEAPRDKQASTQPPPRKE